MSVDKRDTVRLGRRVARETSQTTAGMDRGTDARNGYCWEQTRNVDVHIVVGVAAEERIAVRKVLVDASVKRERPVRLLNNGRVIVESRSRGDIRARKHREVRLANWVSESGGYYAAAVIGEIVVAGGIARAAWVLPDTRDSGQT